MADSQHTPKPPAVPTSVYLFYDKHGLLLYVGITSRGVARQSEHNSTKEWWPYVARQEVEHYPNRRHAAERERGLIRRFRPPFNKQHNPDHEATRAAYLDMHDKLAGSKASPVGILYAGRGGERVTFDAKRFGPGYLLRSKPSHLGHLAGLDIQSAHQATIVTDGVKGARGRVIQAAETGAGFVIQVAFKKSIGHRRAADLVLRMPVPSQGLVGITIKQIRFRAVA